MEDKRDDTKKVAVCLIKNTEGKYLLTRPSDVKHFGVFQDAWYPPTGHVKEGESIIEALRREAKEELNIDVKPVRLITKWKQDTPGEIAYWWECEIVGGDIQMNEEIAEYKYFSAEECKKVKMWPAEESFFENFIWTSKVE